MRVGNVFGRVCLSFCPSVCLSVCVSVCSDYNFWTGFTQELHFWYGGTSWPYLGRVWVSRPLSQGQGHVQKMTIYLFHLVIPFVYTYRPLIRSRSYIKVKVTHQGQIKVNIKLRSFLSRDTLTRVVCIWIKCVLVCFVFLTFFVEHIYMSYFGPTLWYFTKVLNHVPNI